MVQVFTGHGCFGEYLHRIGKELTARCHHCGRMGDTAVHTLGVCLAWAEDRRVLQDAMEGAVSLRSMIPFMLRGETEWKAAVSFCESVMTQKDC